MLERLIVGARLGLGTLALASAACSSRALLVDAGEAGMGQSGGASGQDTADPMSSGSVPRGEAGADEAELPSAEEIQREIRAIAGTSFVVNPTPLPDGFKSEMDGSCPTDLNNAVSTALAFVDSITLHFEEGAAGELLLTTSTLGPWLNVQTSKVIRTSAGWSVVDPPPTSGCLAQIIDEGDGWLPYWAIPSEMSSDSRCWNLRRPP